MAPYWQESDLTHEKFEDVAYQAQGSLGLSQIPTLLLPDSSLYDDMQVHHVRSGEEGLSFLNLVTDLPDIVIISQALKGSMDGLKVSHTSRQGSESFGLQQAKTQALSRYSYILLQLDKLWPVCLLQRHQKERARLDSQNKH